jgi:hypothetical protein
MLLVVIRDRWEEIEISVKSCLVLKATCVSMRRTWYAMQLIAQYLKLTVWLNGREKSARLWCTSLRQTGFGSERLCR